jgi:hypothetical protein
MHRVPMDSRPGTQRPDRFAVPVRKLRKLSAAGIADLL